MPARKKPAEAATGRKHGPRPREIPYAVTTIRLDPAQWLWLRQEALRRAGAGGAGRKADASAIVRELVDRAMKGRQ